MRKSILLLCFSLLVLNSAHAGIYYVSNEGDDNNNGLSKDHPVQTLKKAAESVLPGDVIMLRRGDIFRESVEIKPGNISICAYGEQDKPLPVVSGAIPIEGFSHFRDGIYVAEIDFTPGYLFFENKLLSIARYPNDGWLRTRYWEDSKIPHHADPEQLAQANTMISCPELQEYAHNKEDFWIGANIRWRHHSWWFETREIIDYESSGRLFLNDRSSIFMNPHPGTVKGWGFYLDNKLELLDTPGEWYFDKEKKRIYIFPPEGKDPNEFQVEASVRSTGIQISDGVVHHIKFQHQQDIGLEIGGVSVVQYCDFEGIGRDAKPSEGGDGGAALLAKRDVQKARISYNSFRDNFNKGIFWLQDPNDSTSSTIERNNLENSGVIAGYGGSGPWHAVAILIASGKNVHVQYNQIQGSGYVGILFGTDGNYAEYNIIENAMATMNDGGGIYTNCSHSTIRHNIIMNTRGGMESSGSWPTIAHGIWPEFLGEYRENIIEFNTVIGSGGDGIFLTNNFECIIRNNVCYNNDRFQLLIMGRGDQNKNVSQNHLITGNVLYAASPSQNTLYFDGANDYGILKENYFCKPFSDRHIQEGKGWPQMNQDNHKHFTLNEWQKQYSWADTTPKTDPGKLLNGEEEHSKIIINQTEQTRTFTLKGQWQNLDGEAISGSLILEPYTSQVLIKD